MLVRLHLRTLKYMKLDLILILNSGFQYEHSHKKDILKTQAVLTDISMSCWNLPSGRKYRGSSKKKTWLSLTGISCSEVIFVLIWVKHTLIWWMDDYAFDKSIFNFIQRFECYTTLIVKKLLYNKKSSKYFYFKKCHNLLKYNHNQHIK